MPMYESDPVCVFCSSAHSLHAEPSTDTLAHRELLAPPGPVRLVHVRACTVCARGAHCSIGSRVAIQLGFDTMCVMWS
jgi:hypothetical protein